MCPSYRSLPLHIMLNSLCCCDHKNREQTDMGLELVGNLSLYTQWVLPRFCLRPLIWPENVILTSPWRFLDARENVCPLFT